MKKTILQKFLSFMPCFHNRTGAKYINSEIKRIVREQYNDYNGGRHFIKMKEIHRAMRKFYGAKRFMIYLQKMEKYNPRPQYKMPPLNGHQLKTLFEKNKINNFGIIFKKPAQ